jgi:hypothetical protein
MKLKNKVNEGLRLLNGIAVAAPAVKIGLNIAYSIWHGFLLVTPAP